MTDEPVPPAIEARGLSRRFGGTLAVDAVDLEVRAGEALAVFGPNGAGKTTLLRLLTLGLRPTTGTFRIAGCAPRRDSLLIRRQIGVIAHATRLYDALTGRENLELYARLYGVAEPRARAAELLRSIDLEHRADEPVRVLSRGLKQRLTIARALVHDPALLFLDEPFAALDPQATALLRAALGEARARGTTIVLVTHNLGLGLALADRFVLLARGRIEAEGRAPGTDPLELERRHFPRSTAAGRTA